MKNIAGVLLAVCILMLLVPSPGMCRSISNITLSPASPATLKFGEDVTISFEYAITQPGGIRIFVQPLTMQKRTPNFAVSGSPLYPSGKGKGSGTITIRSGKTVVVDHIQVRVVADTSKTLLFEFALPVQYTFAATATPVVGTILPRKLTLKPSVSPQLDRKARLNLESSRLKLRQTSPQINLDQATSAPGGTYVYMQTVTRLLPPDPPPETDKEWLNQMNSWIGFVDNALSVTITILAKQNSEFLENTMTTLDEIEQENTLYTKVHKHVMLLIGLQNDILNNEEE